MYGNKHTLLLNAMATCRNALATGGIGVLVCLAVAACGGADGSKSADNQSADSKFADSSTPLGPSGGTVSIQGLALLEVPPGLLAADSTVQVSVADERQPQSETLSKTIHIDMSQGHFQPGAATDQTVTVRIPTDTATQAGLAQQISTPFTSDYLRSNGAMAVILDAASDKAVAVLPVWTASNNSSIDVEVPRNYCSTASGCKIKFIKTRQVKELTLYRWANKANPEPVAGAQTGLGQKIPLVLIHGVPLLSAGCSGSQIWQDAWQSFRENFLQNEELVSKYEIYTVAYSSNRSFKENGAKLSQALAGAFGKKPVVIVAQSIGGLVARAADVFSKAPALGYSADIKISRVITINTPHHGSNAISSLAQFDTTENNTNAGKQSLQWDGVDTGADGNPDLKKLNENRAHLSRYILYADQTATSGTQDIAAPTASQRLMKYVNELGWVNARDIRAVRDAKISPSLLVCDVSGFSISSETLVDIGKDLLSFYDELNPPVPGNPAPAPLNPASAPVNPAPTPANPASAPTPAPGIPAIPSIPSIPASSPTPATPPAGLQTLKLPHTGITNKQCYKAGSDEMVACDGTDAISLNKMQDGMRGSNANRKYSNVASFSKEECVKDDITGLVWEGKTATGLRAASNTYSNFDAAYTGAGGAQAIYAASNSLGYVNAVNKLNLCGFSDWRMPTVDELQTLADYSKPWPGPAIDMNWFPNTKLTPKTKADEYGISEFHVRSTNYWTSTPCVGLTDTSNSFTFNFVSGVTDIFPNYFRGGHIRLVRSSQ